MKISLRTIVLAVSLTCLANMTGGAQAQSLRYNNFMGPRSPEVIYTKKFIKELQTVTNGKLRGQVFAGGQLLGGRASLGGVRDSIVDAVFIVPTLNSSEIPSIAMMPSTLPFADNFWAASGASNETPMLNCPECKDELAKQNAVWFGGYAASPWYLMCRNPINSADDIRGKKVRVTGGFATRMIASLGAVGVSLPPGDIAPGLQQGQIDCAVGNLAWLNTLGLINTVKTIVDVPLGSYHGLGLFVINRKSLDKLGASEKEAFIKLVPKYVELITREYEDQEMKARAAAEKKKIVFWKPSKEVLDALAKFRQGEMKALVAEMEKNGAKNAKANLEKHLATLKRWVPIAEKTRRTPGAFAKALWDEVYSKIKM